MLLNKILQQPHKSLEDSHFVFESIRKFRFFENFFAQNLKTLDSDAMISLCQTFQYEQVSMGHFVFQKGDPSNNKFYVILSGQVSIIMPRKEDEGRKKADQKNKRKLTKMKATMMSLIGNPESPSVKKYEASAFSSNINLTGPSLEQSGYQSTFKGLDSMCPPVSSRYTTNREKKIVSTGNSPFGGVDDKLFSDKVDEVNTERNSSRNTTIQMALSRFQEAPAEAGNVLRCLRKGESFGELALRTAEPRSASIFCNTDCEFLVITKEQFDAVFAKKEVEKEYFLKSMFPSLLTGTTSTAKLNMVFYSFKTEAYGKDAYLTTEGRIADGDAKIYIIQQGECKVEKNYTGDVINSNDKSHKPEKFTLAVIGKGTIIGEETLINPQEYCFSVKALSENVIVHTVTRKELEASIFKDFNRYLLEMYEAKIIQRQATYESLMREHEAKVAQYKEANLYTQSLKLKRTVSTSTIQGFSRYLHLDQKNSDSKDISRTEASLPTEVSGYGTKTSLFPLRLHKESRTLKRPDIRSQLMGNSRDNIRGDRSADADDSKNQSLNMTNDLYNKAPNWFKPSKDFVPEPKDLEEMRFFEVNPRKIHQQQRNSQAKINGFSESRKSSLGLKNIQQNPIDALLKGIVKKARRAKHFTESMVDVKGNQKLENNLSKDMQEQKPVIKKLPILSEGPLPGILKYYDQKDKTPVNNTSSQQLGKIGKHRPSVGFSGGTTPSMKNTQPKEKAADVLNTFITMDSGSYRDRTTPFSKYPVSTLEDADRLDCRRTPNNASINANRTPELFSMTLHIDLEIRNKTPNPQRRIVNTTTNCDSVKQIGILTSPVNPRLHELPVRHSTPLLNTRDWRNGIFKKIPRINETKIPTIQEFKISQKTGGSPKNMK